MYTAAYLGQKTFIELKAIACEFGISPAGDRRCRQSWIDALVNVNLPLLELLEVFPAASVEQVQKPIDVQAQESPIESKFGRIVYSRPAQEPIAQAAENFPGVEVEQVQEPIAQAAENFPGVEVEQVQEPITQAAENSPGVKTQVTVSESAIGSAAKNPLLTGVTLSDRFCARYSPPQPEIIHFQSDADGQLSLLDFEIESLDEPPDPDDFESLDAFREAIALWDAEHPSSFDRCSDYLPSSEDNDVSSEDKALQVSLDSFSLWAPCLHTWYEPVGLYPSEVMELLRVGDSSDTSNFFIPTFSADGDCQNRSDEPPDTGIYARLPKPKPLCFPPTVLGQAHIKRILNAYQTHPKRISNAAQLHIIYFVAGNNSQPGRSPPGGDASSA